MRKNVSGFARKPCSPYFNPADLIRFQCSLPESGMPGRPLQRQNDGMPDAARGTDLFVGRLPE
jgi:hypothetical protein